MASSTSVSDTMVCRCCLQDRENLICIFKEVNEIISLSYAAIVKSCFDLQITVGDGLPSQICCECSKEVERVYNFKKICLSSEEHLRPSATFRLERNKEVACQTDEFQAYTEQNVVISTPEKKSVEVAPQSLEDENHLKEPVQNDGRTKDSVEGSALCLNDAGENDKESNILAEPEKSLCTGVCDDILSSIPDKDCGDSASNVIGGEGPKFPLHVETQVRVEAEDILGNSLDFPFVEEISPSGQDSEKDKDGDLVGGNALKDIISSLNSPVTDITDWLDGDEGQKDASATSARNLSQALEGGKESSEESNIPCESEEVDNVKGLVSSVKELSTDEPPDEPPDENHATECTDEEKAEENQELGGGCEKDVAGEHENQMTPEEDVLPSSPIIGKLTIKPLEDLTCSSNQAMHSTEALLTSDDASVHESESTIETRNELSLTNLLKKSDSKNGGSNSVDLVGDVSEDDHCLKDRTLGQIITDSLDKEDSENPPDGESSEVCIRAELGGGLGPDLGDDNCSDNFTAENRKRSWENFKGEGMTEDISEVDPLSKKICTVENLIGGKEDSSKEVGEVGGDPLPSNEVFDGDKEKTAEGGTDFMGEVDESANQGEVAMEAENNIFSDDDDILRDNDSVSNSSGSEYIPADSPTGSDESPRPTRRSSRPTEKVEVRNLRKQGYHIRECRVVLSDIAHSGSGANSLSSHLSVSSLKSLENDSEITKVDKKDLRNETDDISDNASSCAAWIKVEPEDMKELEEEHGNEGVQDEEGAQMEGSGLWHAASNDATAEQIPRPSDGTQPALAKVFPGRKLFRCPFCAKGFRTRNQMIIHRGVHTGDLPYPCEVCGKRFALRCRLLRHMSVHDSSIVCEFCGMDFKTNILLGRHIKSKHTIPSYPYNPALGVPPPLVTPPPQEAAPLPSPPKATVQRFPCRLCPRVFSSMNGLKGHKRVHVSKKGPSRQSIIQVEQKSSNENTCNICGMSFPNPLYLKSHMVCHTIIRPNSGKVNLIEASGADESQRMGLDAGLQEQGMNLMEPTVLIHESSSTYGESSYALQNQSGGMRQYICTVCSQIFQSQAKLMRHQVLTHHNQQSFKCDMCPSILANAVQLQNHKLSVHSAPSAIKKEHKCKVCGKVFSRSSRLNQHMNYHLTVEPVSCKICGEYFENTEHLDYHTQTIHETKPSPHIGGMSGTNDLTCSVCRRVFSKRSRLKRHMMLHETQSFPCSKCSKAFISEELLAEHLISHEQNPSQSPSASVSPAVSQSPVAEEGVTCTACGRSFANKTRLKQHVVMHTKSGFVACQNCLKVFANRQVLESHAQTCSNSDEQHSASQSSTNFKSASLPHMSGFSSCTNCGKAFPSKGLLTEHEKTCVGVTVVKKQDGMWKVLETDDRARGNGSGSNIIASGKHTPTTSPSGDTKSHVCKFCGKRFNNYHGLNSHMRFHQDTTGVFKCDLCDKTFPSRNKLSQHMSSHSAVYRCGICSQAFGLVEELKKHVSQCMSAQSGITPNYFFCNGCSEAFNLLEELAEHVTCHANEFPHICTVCYKVFEHPSQLNRHMITHGKMESGNKHTCKVCQKTFSNSACLEKHSVVHTGEKKFECLYCFQRFSQKSSLNRHQLTQHETKQ